jgi:N-glycosylase/DNA lyase
MKNKFSINIDNSINSGQVFLWRKNKDYWYGVNGTDILKIDKNAKIESFQNKMTDFFRETDDMQEIIKSISKDKIVKDAVKKFQGMRILRQDPFQCLISFIVSSNSNIPKIKFCLENITKKFGKKVKWDGLEFHLFPKPQKLAKASPADIKSCGVGYRDSFIIQAAKMVSSKEIDFEDLKKMNYNDAKEEICKIPGVGNKVADCVMLFSLDKLESVPLDRWIVKILSKYYNDKFEIKTKTITPKQYDVLHQKIIKYFGPYAGYSQQFLFKSEREKNQRNWVLNP